MAIADSLPQKLSSISTTRLLLQSDGGCTRKKIILNSNADAIGAKYVRSGSGSAAFWAARISPRAHFSVSELDGYLAWLARCMHFCSVVGY